MKARLIFAALLLLVGAPLVAQQDEAGNRTADEPEQSRGETSPVDPEQVSPLKELDWMVGRWVDEGEGSTITTECSWVHGDKFLSRSFQVSSDGEVVLSGTQVIGWDPLEGQIRSWTFDSEGGRGEGRWYRDGDRWLIKTSFVLATGERASAINVITYVDEDTLRWQSTNREIAGELQPNIPEVTVVRQREKATSQKEEKAQ